VYKVDHPKYGQVILKIGYYSTPTSQEGWEFERIEREINILRQIDSSFYPKNFGFEKISKNRYFILEEFIESTPLTNCMDRFYSPFAALTLTRQLTEGLKIIWDKKIVHRDLKPDNILITGENSPRIIDLGIARILDLDSITQTQFGGPLSRDYAAPEQHKYNKELINWRTDQYNLGIILMQLILKGNHPFSPSLVGGNSIRENIMSNNWYKGAFADKNLLPLQPIASNLLGFEQYRRYRTFDLFIRDLDSCLEGFK
jgi:serine/threonine-protein kinase